MNEVHPISQERSDTCECFLSIGNTCKIFGSIPKITMREARMPLQGLLIRHARACAHFTFSWLNHDELFVHVSSKLFKIMVNYKQKPAV